MGKFKDLTGMKFGWLTVIEKADKNKCGQWRWRCKCDCGNETVVDGPSLTRGLTTSCGCKYKITSAENCRKNFTKHHETGTRLYKIWQDMKKRCHNSNDPDYVRYGARGIKVCDEWRNSYEAFRDWALANGYSDKLTIDRRDNNLGYFPLNCRWATPKVQANNTRRNRRIYCRGEVHNLGEWADIVGIGWSTIKHRLNHGWAIEAALYTPVGEEPYQGKPLYDEDGFMVLCPVKGVTDVDAAITKYRSDRNLW